MTTKKPPPPADKDKKPQPKEGPVKTMMKGESGDDDLGYDPAIIPTEKIPDDD